MRCPLFEEILQFHDHQVPSQERVAVVELFLQLMNDWNWVQVKLLEPLENLEYQSLHLNLTVRGKFGQGRQIKIHHVSLWGGAV